jgi:uncharacterized protein YndB with AHSA1/START domain
MGKLSVVIRDMLETSCQPYDESPATFYAIVLTCDWYYFDSFRCDRVGPGGGGIYGELEVPEGEYLVYAYGWPWWVETDLDWVQVGCEETACVNLVPIYFSQAAARLQGAITAALAQSGGSMAVELALHGEKKATLQRAQQAIAELQHMLPEYGVPGMALPALQEADAPADLVKIVSELHRHSGGKKAG